MKTETFSYLPPLNGEQVAKQIQYFMQRGWIAGIEFSQQPNPRTAYWHWWKLPMFGFQSPDDVLTELEACRSAHPDSYIRLTAYDTQRQGQVMAFVVAQPQGPDQPEDSP
jgi:ribulose-bisphosphate carboxylase small chain